MEDSQGTQGRIYTRSLTLQMIGNKMREQLRNRGIRLDRGIITLIWLKAKAILKINGLINE